MRFNTRKLILACASAAVIILAAASLIYSTRQPDAGSGTARANRAAPGSPAPASSASTTPPDVNAAAFKGQGRLAFVRHGLLYVLDGRTGTLRQVTTDGTAASPAWSYDGQWLAFLHAADSQGFNVWDVWLERPDGTQARQVPVSSGSYSSPRPTKKSSAFSMMILAATANTKRLPWPASGRRIPAGRENPGLFRSMR